MDKNETLDNLHKAVDENGYHRGYPSGPDDDRLVNFSEKELRLIVWAYGCELRVMKEKMGQIQEDMWHEALYDHEENIIRMSKSPRSKATTRCFAIKETTVLRIHSLCMNN
jgi:hypothetical protein